MSDLVVIEEQGATVVIQEVAAADIVEVVAAGPQGLSGTISIAQVNTVAPGVPAAVRNVGTSTDAILQIDIPRGDTGDITPELQALANSSTSAAQAAAASQTAATTKASEAATSAAAASGSANTSAIKASEALASAATATTKAAEASSSATSAATSETSATTSKNVAATSATNALASKDAAATSATNAADSATTASTKADEAASSATAAASAKNAAESARDQTLAAFDNFDDRYLGQKAVDPTVDNDGNALVGGALYFNSAPLAYGGGMKVYDGSAWLAAYASLSGALISANNLSDLASASAARINLGLGNVENKSAATILGELTGSNVTNALGYTPYNATNPSGFITSAALAPYLTSATAASTYQPLLGYVPVNKAGDTFTGAVLTSNAGGFTANSAAKLWTDSNRGRLDLWEGAAQTKSLRVFNANGYGIVGMTSAENLELWTNGTARLTLGGSGNVTASTNILVNNGTDSRVLLQVSGVTEGQFQSTATAVRLASNNALPLYLSQNGVDLLGVTTAEIVGNRQFRVPTSSAYNFAFVGEQAAGTGRYNLYMSGTAQNWFAGNVGIGSGKSVPATALDVNGTVTATQFNGSAAGLTGLKTVNGNSIIGSGNIQIDGGVVSFNTRTGAVTLSSGDVTTALGFTPYNVNNPSGYITSSGIAANVSGTVAVANGGTGVASLTANNVLLGNGTSAVQVVAPGTAGNVLTSDGTTWASATPTPSSQVYPGAGMAVSTGTAWATSKTTPTGDVVGTSDTQTLTNKTFGDNPAFSGGTANGVPYLNGSKVLTTGSALVFDGSNLGLGVTPSAWSGQFKAFELGTSKYACFGQRLNTTKDLFIGWNAYNDSTGTSGINGFKYINTGDGAAMYAATELAGHRWFTAPSGTAGDVISFTQAMTLDSTGGLRVGRTTNIFNAASSEKFSVSNPVLGCAASFQVTDTSGGYPILQLSSTDSVNSGVQNAILFYRGGSIVGSISTQISSTSYNISSDYRLKNITGPITTSGAYIDSLNPVEGTWKVDGSTFVGLIAHEVQEVSRTPVATGTKDGEQMQGMDYSSAEIIANLIAEVKSLRVRVAALESN